MAQPLCPKCSREYVLRVARSGLREYFLSLFYVYPFRCQLCGHRFRLLQWGVNYAKIAEDRRQYRRLPIEFPVTFVGENVSGTATAVDISMRGCTLDPSAQLAEGTIVRMTLRLSAELVPIAVDAAIARNAEKKRVGMEFLRLLPGERDRLQTVIRSHLVNRRG